MNVVPCLHNIERVNVIRNWHSFVPSWDSENKRNTYHIGYLLVNVWEKRKHKHKDKNPCLNHIKRRKVEAQNPWDSFWKLWPSFQQRIHIKHADRDQQPGVLCVIYPMECKTTSNVGRVIRSTLPRGCLLLPEKRENSFPVPWNACHAGKTE